MALSPQILMKNSHSIQYGRFTVLDMASVKNRAFGNGNQLNSHKKQYVTVSQSQYQIITVHNIEMFHCSKELAHESIHVS